MGRTKKDPNAEDKLLTVSGPFMMRIQATELIPDDSGNVIAWKGKGEFVNPFTDEWEKLPQGTRGLIARIEYGEGEEKKVVKLNFKVWLEHLMEEAKRTPRTKASK